MQTDDSAVTTDLVLVGGGHSHLFVLRYFAMNPIPGVRITLVTRDLHTPYSGMLPGYIAGHYEYDQANIDLLPLARYAGARVVHAEVNAIDAENKRVFVHGRPALDYDLLSINIGSRPSLPVGVTSGRDQFAIKPVDRFIENWQQFEQDLQHSTGEQRLVIIGGGAGGVELALALDYRGRNSAQWPGHLKLAIVTDRERLLPGHNERVQRQFVQILEQRSIEVFYQHSVSGFDDGFVVGDFAEPIAANAAIWATHASPASWLSSSGLALDKQGFIAVNHCLQSISHADVFASGDIAAVDDYPRPKSGVFAVRQGIPLARNLANRAGGRKLRPFRPQKNFLSLISSGDKYAVASRDQWSLAGKWCWWLKDKIDRRFIRRFSEFPEMAQPESSDEDITPMRCGGCGSKIGSVVLQQVLEQMDQKFAGASYSGFEHADDAALITPPPGQELLQSIDHFRSFIDDPYLFGRIATNHALGDLHAMGVEAHSALVIANVVYASETKQAQDLFQLMSGVLEALQENETLLVGGHSGEAAQMNCGLNVNGFARRENLMLKNALQPGDQLILTRPLGSGVLFAADMQGKSRGAWIDEALEHMLVSNRAAAACLRQYGVRACTDVTGFGLAGHLFEMARASNCAVEILLDQLPLYSGVIDLAAQGITSSLQPQNTRIRHSIVETPAPGKHAAYPLLFDPQTAGGLLAAVSKQDAEVCLQELRCLGYPATAIVG